MVNPFAKKPLPSNPIANPTFNNHITVIKPYFADGCWGFDDERFGLVHELFVAGADKILEELITFYNVKDAEKGHKLIFGKSAFPGSQKLTWQREEGGGNVYEWVSPNGDKKIEGWLCPALFYYFAAAPREIYVKAETLNHE